MARRHSYVSVINQIARDTARAQRISEQQRIKIQKQQAQAAVDSYTVKIRQEKDLKALKQQIAQNSNLTVAQREKLISQAEKAAQQQYIEARTKETVKRNEELEATIRILSNILQHTLMINDSIQFDELLIKEEYQPFSIPQQLSQPTYLPKKEDYLNTVKAPSFIEKLLPGSQDRYLNALNKAMHDFEIASNKYIEYEKWRNAELTKLKAQYECDQQAFEQKKIQRNLEVKELENAYQEGDENAILTYCSMVLERSQYPEGFPQEFRLAFVPESKEIVIEYELPDLSVIPMVEEYKYIKTKDAIEEKNRKSSDIRDLYQDIVSAVCLRTIHEVIEADQCNNIEVVIFNGFVQTVDPATGKNIRPHLISVRTTRPEFVNIDLSRIDKKACLRNLGAQLSPRPAEMQSVKPIIEFDMVDKRFVEESDILTDLESRPNLMDLNPFEFENLVSNLFTRMGLDTKQTRSSKDGGVDAVAFDIRPVLGGKVVIQAKRYKNTVGVSAVRDLYGTMMNEGANKGILVTTSGYGPDAYEFSKDKPIELIDGGGLLYLLDQVGVKARIIFPED